MLGAVGTAAAPWFIGIPGARRPFFAAGLLLAAVTAAGFRENRKNEHRRAAVIMALGGVILQIYAVLLLLPELERVKLSPAMARAVLSSSPPGAPIADLAYGEPSLVFYLGRQVSMLENDKAALSWIESEPDGILVCPRERAERLKKTSGFPWKETVSVRGYNFAKGKWMELVALTRIFHTPSTAAAQSRLSEHL